MRSRLDKTKVRTTEPARQNSYEAAAGGAEGQGDPRAHERATPVSPPKSSWRTLCASSDVRLHKSVCCAHQPAACCLPAGVGAGVRRWPHSCTAALQVTPTSLLSPDSNSCELTAHLPPPHPGCSLGAHFPLKDPPQSRAWASDRPPGFVPLAGGAPQSSQGPGHSSHGRRPGPHKHRGLEAQGNQVPIPRFSLKTEIPPGT